MFLSKDDLKELTGFKLASKQCEWLAEHDYPFDTNRNGQPKVLVSYLQQRLCPRQNTALNYSEQPNFDALN